MRSTGCKVTNWPYDATPVQAGSLRICMHHKPPKRQSPHRPRKSVGALGGIRKSPPCTLDGLQKAIKPQGVVQDNNNPLAPATFWFFKTPPVGFFERPDPWHTIATPPAPLLRHLIATPPALPLQFSTHCPIAAWFALLALFKPPKHQATPCLSALPLFGGM